MKQKYIGFFVAFLLVLVFIPSVFAAEQNGTCGDNLTWALEEGELTISGSGAMQDYTATEHAPWYVQQANITKVSLQDGITSVGDYAFWGMTSLSSVSISEDVTVIGSGAFSGCIALSSISLPSKLTVLGEEAFTGANFNALTVPGGVKTIEARTFSGCGRLSRITLRQGTKTIESGAFESCGSLTEITIPASVTVIQDSAFSDCESLSQVNFGGTQADWEAIAPDQIKKSITVYFDGANCTHVPDQGIVTREPTCTELGQRTYTCTLCGTQTTGTIPVLSHSYQSQVTPPTCTDKGYTTHTCSGCGKQYTDTYVDSTGHTWNLGQVTLSATCTTEGVKTFSCKTCSQTKTESVPVTDHTYLEKVTLPTCTAQGYTTHTCACGDSFVDSYIDPTGHSYIDSVTAPTCTTQGYTTHTCACGDSFVDSYIDPTGHSYADSVTAPTCTAQGYTTHDCSCGYSFVDTYTDPILHDYDLGTVTKIPTCTSPGEKTFTCRSCQGTKTEPLPCLDHNYGQGIVTKQPTCTHQGEITYSCLDCGASYTHPIEKAAHSYTLTVTFPTCTADGYTTHTCSCGQSFVDSYTHPTGHSYSDSVTAPTCTAGGYTTHTCSCGDSYVDSYVDSTGHNWDSGKVTTAPSCTNIGVKSFTCSDCGETATEPIAKTPHVYTDSITAPTCTKKGYTTHICSCGDCFVDSYTDPLGHCFDQGSLKTSPTITAQGTKSYLCIICGLEKQESVAPFGNPFTDVYAEHYFYESVIWAVEKDITKGISATSFCPDAPCTRSQVVTFLWRAAGSPAPTVTEHRFTDVDPEGYYYDAMLWALEKGITKGISATSFGPNEPCTRSQVVTFLWRAAGEPSPTIASHSFTDVMEQEYYYEAMLWALEHGITLGMSATDFGPGLACTRGQVVTFLHRASR